MKPSEIYAAKMIQQTQPLFNEGSAHYHSGDLARARAFFESVIIIYPMHFDAIHLLGVIDARTNHFHSAVSRFKQAAAIEPNNPRVYNNLGQVLDELKNYDAALAHFDRAISLDPHYAQAIANKQAILARQTILSTE